MNWGTYGDWLVSDWANVRMWVVDATYACWVGSLGQMPSDRLYWMGQRSRDPVDLIEVSRELERRDSLDS